MIYARIQIFWAQDCRICVFLHDMSEKRSRLHQIPLTGETPAVWTVCCRALEEQLRAKLQSQSSGARHAARSAQRQLILSFTHPVMFDDCDHFELLIVCDILWYSISLIYIYLMIITNLAQPQATCAFQLCSSACGFAAALQSQGVGLFWGDQWLSLAKPGDAWTMYHIVSPTKKKQVDSLLPWELGCCSLDTPPGRVWFECVATCHGALAIENWILAFRS